VWNEFECLTQRRKKSSLSDRPITEPHEVRTKSAKAVRERESAPGFSILDVETERDLVAARPPKKRGGPPCRGSPQQREVSEIVPKSNGETSIVDAEISENGKGR
jgi:hypothetical protein